MQAAIIMARGLLHCRLVEGSHDALVEWVADLLDVASRGATPFFSMSTPQVVAEVHARPQHAHASHGALE